MLKNIFVSTCVLLSATAHFKQLIQTDRQPLLSWRIVIMQHGAINIDGIVTKHVHLPLLLEFVALRKELQPIRDGSGLHQLFEAAWWQLGCELWWRRWKAKWTRWHLHNWRRRWRLCHPGHWNTSESALDFKNWKQHTFQFTLRFKNFTIKNIVWIEPMTSWCAWISWGNKFFQFM